MTAMSDWIVREYFEAQGFMVLQPCKYQVAARHKLPSEEVDLLLARPSCREHKVARHVLWGTAELESIARAVVGIRGWHTDRFGPSLVSLSPDLCRFAEPKAVAAYQPILGAGPVARILCLPELPATRVLKEKSLDLLRERGVDGVLSFRHLLVELAAKVDPRKRYEKSDLLQLLRILKSYDLLKDAQMELFGKQRRARQSSKPVKGPA